MTLHGVPLEPTQWDLVAPSLLESQRILVRWMMQGGPMPEIFTHAA